MSRPPGPPPYTAEQIAALSTATERFIAQAELRSYIAGHKLADLREKGINDSFGHLSTGEDKSDEGPRSSNNNLLKEEHTNGTQEEGTERPSGPIRNRSWRERGPSGFQSYTPYHQPREKFSARYNATSSVESLHKAVSSSTSGLRINRCSTQSPAKFAKSMTLCPVFTSTGKCARRGCPDIHDTDKLALCKPFLFKDDCGRGSRCLLSHKPSPNNTPHCLYYLDGRCTNSSCQFAHAHVEPKALVCDNFGRVGYCEDGDQCTGLHVYECPGFANTGTCPAGESCNLKHVHHASRIKSRFSSGPATPRSDESDGDLSDVGIIRDDTDSPPSSHAITQQHDYVPFDAGVN